VMMIFSRVFRYIQLANYVVLRILKYINELLYYYIPVVLNAFLGEYSRAIKKTSTGIKRENNSPVQKISLTIN